MIQTVHNRVAAATPTYFAPAASKNLASLMRLPVYCADRASSRRPQNAQNLCDVYFKILRAEHDPNSS
jgi:hypothetical protein